MRIGFFLASEEFGPTELVEQARAAERSGFEALWISDHYHPWNDAQGQSPFVWSVIGAVSQACRLPITTAVTCPTVRIHPAVLAQAAATSAVMCEGRFVLGVGSGEALNEHIFGDPWPTAEVRLEMLEEAVEVMRALWSGEFVNHRGRHYTVDQARIYTLPDQPPPVYVSGFGRKSVALAARIGDGYIVTAPAGEMVSEFRGSGGGDKPVQGAFKGCFAADADEAVQIAYERWPNSGLPGELSQVLPSPRHFEQASELVRPEMIRERFVCGPDPRAHLEKIEAYAKAGFDEVYVANVGPHYDGFFRMYAEHVFPAATLTSAFRPLVRRVPEHRERPDGGDHASTGEHAEHGAAFAEEGPADVGQDLRLGGGAVWSRPAGRADRDVVAEALVPEGR